MKKNGLQIITRRMVIFKHTVLYLAACGTGWHIKV